MLIYSEERYIATEVNMMLLRAKDNVGYFYVHRGLYDQAVILDDIYGETPEKLVEELCGETTMRADVAYVVENLPKPINILGCFLCLVAEELIDPIDMIGAIHVMSGPLNLRKVVQIPKEVRNSFTFSLTIKEEYELAWDRFFKEAIPFDRAFYTKQESRPMNGTNTVITDEDIENMSEEERDEYADQLILDALNDGSDFDDWDLDEDEDEEEEKEAAPVTPVTTPTPEPVAVAEPKPEAPKPKRNLDFIRGL